MEFIPRRLQFPLNETYWAFGDGSETAGGVFYGLVLLPESSIAQAETVIKHIKRSYGGNEDAPVHCRELFNDKARKKSAWSHLTHNQAFSLCGDILRETARFSPKHLIGYMLRESYPKRMRLVGKNGHPDLVHAVDSKWLTLWAYFRIAALLDPAEIIKPADVPRPQNCPGWQILIRRTERGMRVRKLFLDREQTKVRWFSKTLQWTSMAKDLVIEGPSGKSNLPVQPSSLDKNPLIEVADIFAYSFGRQLLKEPMPYPNVVTEVHVEVLSRSGDELVFGGKARYSLLHTSHNNDCSFDSADGLR